MNTQKCDKLTSTHTLWLGVCIEQIQEVMKGKEGTQKGLPSLSHDSCKPHYISYVFKDTFTR